MTRDEFEGQIDLILDSETGSDNTYHVNVLLACYDEQREEIARLKEKIAHYDRWLSAGVYYTNEEFLERVLKPKEQLQSDLNQVLGEAVQFAEFVRHNTFSQHPTALAARTFLESETVQAYRARQSET